MLCPVYVEAKDPKVADMFESQISVLSGLTKGCQSAQVIRMTTDVPEGCASEVVSADVTVHLMVKVRPLCRCFLLIFVSC